MIAGKIVFETSGTVKAVLVLAHGGEFPIWNPAIPALKNRGAPFAVLGPCVTSARILLQRIPVCPILLVTFFLWFNDIRGRERAHSAVAGRGLSEVNGKIVAPMLLATAVILASCNDSAWTKPPNVVGSGIVDRIEKTSRSVFGTRSVVYEVRLADPDTPALRYVVVSGSRIGDSDISPSIGKRVSISCYQDDPQSRCYASGYGYDGRELDVRSR